MSKIVRLKSENIKRLHAVEIEPDGSMVVIGGQNGAGKTSVLDSIEMAFNGLGSVPDVPIRQGERKALAKTSKGIDEPRQPRGRAGLNTFAR